MNPLTHFKKISTFCLLLIVLSSSPSGRAFAQSPLDLWSSDTQQRIRDQNTLNYTITAQTGYFEVWVVDVQPDASGELVAGQPRQMTQDLHVDAVSGLSWGR